MLSQVSNRSLFHLLLTALAMCALLMTAPGCTTMYRNQYVNEHPEMDPQTAADIRAARIRTGMTLEQVRVAWRGQYLANTVETDGKLILIYRPISSVQHWLTFQNGILQRIDSIR